MAELTGVPGFAPPRRENTTSRRRAATIELIAMVGLTISLVIAATAVSLGNRSLTRGELTDRGSIQSPAGVFMDQSDPWILINARFSFTAVKPAPPAGPCLLDDLRTAAPMEIARPGCFAHDRASAAARRP